MYIRSLNENKENETVVKNVLEETDQWEQGNAQSRVASFLAEKNEKLSVSVEPITAATNGFFVALFRRIK